MTLFSILRRRGLRLALPAAAIGTLAVGLVVQANAGSRGAQPTNVDSDITSLQTSLERVADPAERANLQSKIGELQKQQQAELAGRDAADSSGLRGGR